MSRPSCNYDGRSFIFFLFWGAALSRLRPEQTIEELTMAAKKKAKKAAKKKKASKKKKK